jgi:hypothetical protein
VVRLGRLADEVSQWAEQEQWSVLRGEKKIQERRVGAYVAPTVRIRTPGGEVHVAPIALDVMGADGRVEIEAWPSLNRVRLVPAGESWEIITDSNVRLRKPWNQQTFIELVGDLVAAP